MPLKYHSSAFVLSLGLAVYQLLISDMLGALSLLAHFAHLDPVLRNMMHAVQYNFWKQWHFVEHKNIILFWTPSRADY